MSTMTEPAVTDDTGVKDGECLYCYLVRILTGEGKVGLCDGDHTHTNRWIATQNILEDTSWVLRWLQNNGACCCDCEVITVALADSRKGARVELLRCAGSRS